MRRRESKTKRHRFKNNEYKEPGPGVAPRADKMISPEPWECLGSRVDQPEHTYKQLHIRTFGE